MCDALFDWAVVLEPEARAPPAAWMISAVTSAVTKTLRSVEEDGGSDQHRH